MYCRGHHLTSGTTLGCSSGASLWCTAFAIKCTAEAIIQHQEQHWGVLQEPHLGVLHLPSSVLQRPSPNIRNNTEVYFRSLTSVCYICHQVVCISYHVNQEPHMCPVYANRCTEYAIMYIRSFTWCLLHLPSSVLQRPSSNIRNNTRVLFRSLTWVYFICHQVYCRGHHLTSRTTLGSTSGASLECTAIADKCTAYADTFM